MKKKTIVLGASPNPGRYAYHAVHRLLAQGHEVIPMGIKKGAVGDLVIENGRPLLEEVHTITLYINSRIQENYYDYIFQLKPKRIIFNPGTENPELARMAREKEIEVEVACTLVMLSLDSY